MPVQIKLIPEKASYFEQCHLLIAADCAAYSYKKFHDKFMKDKITVIGCPKLDEIDYSEKLLSIIKNNNIKDITVVRMNVPCCAGIVSALEKAIKKSEKEISWKFETISTNGKIL